MRFTLHYSGPLKTSSGTEEKHRLRRAFHPQLVELWKHEPLKHEEHLYKPPEPRPVWQTYDSRRPYGAFTFVPLVTEQMKLAAGLTITMLRPGRRGQLVLAGGDIDNRLKILFDALTMPQQPNSLPAGAQPGASEDPFFVVLEDDALITTVTVDTQQLLSATVDPSHVELFIGVQVTAVVLTGGNSTIGG
jgi:hypothetical protein